MDSGNDPGRFQCTPRKMGILPWVENDYIALQLCAVFRVDDFGEEILIFVETLHATSLPRPNGTHPPWRNTDYTD